ncbi:MAG: hypothetical protein ABI430_04075 [Candidatus Taylorbacteria bacterium]
MARKRDFKFYLKLSVSLLLFFVVLGYGYFRTKDLIEGVVITIDEPQNYSTLTESAFVMKGKIERSSAVFLNGRKIFLDDKGNFSEKLLLSPGYTIITLRAEDKLKRETSKQLELVYKPSS